MSENFYENWNLKSLIILDDPTQGLEPAIDTSRTELTSETE